MWVRFLGYNVFFHSINVSKRYKNFILAVSSYLLIESRFALLTTVLYRPLPVLLFRSPNRFTRAEQAVHFQNRNLWEDIFILGELINLK